MITTLGSTYGTTVTCGTGNTKGAWVELSSDCPHDVRELTLILGNSNVVSSKVLFDVGVVPPDFPNDDDNTFVIVADIIHGQANQANHDALAVTLPAGIVAGSRIKVRGQVDTGGTVQRRVTLLLHEGDPATSVITLGAVPASTNGTEVDCGAVANTKTAWIELIDPLPADAHHAIVVVSNRGATSGGDADYALDIGVGAAAAEVVKVADIPWSRSSFGSDTTMQPRVFSIPLSLLEGSRIAVRGASTTTDATGRVFDVIVLVVTAFIPPPDPPEPDPGPEGRGCRQVFCGRTTEGILSIGDYSSSPTHPETTWRTGIVQGQPWLSHAFFRWYGVRLSVAPGAGRSVIYTIYKNGAPTGLTFTISDDETEGFCAGCLELNDEDDFIVGREVVGGNVPASITWTTCVIDGLDPFVSCYGQATIIAPVAGFLQRIQPLTVSSPGLDSSFYASNVIPFPCVVEKAHFRAGLPLASGVSYTIYALRNGIKQWGQGTTPDTRRTFDTGDTNAIWEGDLSLNAFDRLGWEVQTNSGDPGEESNIGYAFRVRAPVDGYSIIANTPKEYLPYIGGADTLYGRPSTNVFSEVLDADETKVHHINLSPYPVQLFGIWWRTATAFVSHAQRTVGYRVNGASPVGIPSATGQSLGRDVTSLFDVEQGDEWAVQYEQDDNAGIAETVGYATIQRSASQFPHTCVLDTHNPIPGTSLCQVVDDPIMFASWLPASGVARRWYAESSLDDRQAYYGGWKDSRLLGVSEIRRSLSSTDWDYEVGTFSVDFADEDYAIRQAIQDDAPGRFFSRREIEVFMVSPEQRRAELPAMLIATGFTDRDPSVDDYDEAMSLRFSCRDRIGVAMGWAAGGEELLPRRTLTSDTLPGVLLSAYGKAAPYPYGDLTRAIVMPSGVMPSGTGYEHPSARVLAWPVRENVLLPDMQAWHEFILAGCAIQGVDDWVYDPEPTTQTAASLSGIEISLGDGTDWIFPGSAGWTSVMGSSAPYRDIVGADGKTRRFAFAYGRGPKADLAVAGTSRLTVNMRGIERTGDGTGVLITDYFEQNLHKLENLILVDGEGYLTGDWTTPRYFGHTDTYLVDRVSYDVIRALRLAELEGSDIDLPGWIGVGILGAFGEQISVSEELRRQQMGSDFRYGPNQYWQVSQHAINRNLTYDETAPLLDQFDIHIRTFRPYPRQIEMFNDIPYRYRRNYAVDGKWLNDNLRVTGEQSISDWQIKRTMNVLEFHYVDHSLLINKVFEYIARRKFTVPWYIELEGSLCLLDPDYDVGKYVRLTHWRGLKLNGWVDRPLWVLSNTLNPATRRVKLELLDLQPLLDTMAEEFPNA